MTFAMKTFRNLIIAGLCIGGATACVMDEDIDEPTGLTADELAAIADYAEEKCADIVSDIDSKSHDADEATADILKAACQDCGCDLLAATVACRALATCGNGAQASAVSGNTCSVNDCRNSAGCGGDIKCIESGVECGSVANNSGVCTFQ